jgi:hypothetical protein
VLRHIYLSGLARSSREAQHFISVAEFDAFDFALAANQPGDPLQRQNDLRRICGYAVWRKEFSKSASYFIFHFFHGYSRREIAEIARPIAAIYVLAVAFLFVIPEGDLLFVPSPLSANSPP